MKRFQVTGLGTSARVIIEPQGKVIVPAPPELNTPKECLQWMIAHQQEKFGETILQTFSYRIMLRNVKLLYKKYPQNKIMRALVEAQLHANHPYTTACIEDNM